MLALLQVTHTNLVTLSVLLLATVMIKPHMELIVLNIYALKEKSQRSEFYLMLATTHTQRLIDIQATKCALKCTPIIVVQVAWNILNMTN